MSDEKFEPKGTKIDPAMAVVWDAVCQALGTDTYHLIQHFIYAMIRMASDQHNKTPEMERLMTILESDADWMNAINLCAPRGKLSISQIILIVEQEDKKGFGLVMLDKPFFGGVFDEEKPMQTENVNQIIERVFEVGVKGLYRRMRRMMHDLDCNGLVDTMLTMLDAQEIINTEEQERQEGPQMGNQSDFGRVIEIGKKYKQVKHRTPDSLANSQQMIHFTDEDREAADMEVHVPDFRPFDQEE